MTIQEQKKNIEASIRKLFKKVCVGKKTLSFEGVDNEDDVYMHTIIELGHGYYLKLQSDTESESREDLVYGGTLRHRENEYANPMITDLYIRMERGQGPASVVWFVEHFDEYLDELEKVRAICTAYSGAVEHIEDMERAVKEKFATKMADLSLK